MTSVVAPSTILRAYLRGDLEVLDALVNDDDAGELLVIVTEILTGALTASLRRLPQQSSWPPHPTTCPTRG